MNYIKIFLILFLLPFCLSAESKDSTNPGTSKGEEQLIDLQEQWLKLYEEELQKLQAHIENRYKKHLENIAKIKPKLRSKIEYKDFFASTEDSEFKTADDINEFAEHKIRKQLSQKELQDLLNIISNVDLELDRTPYGGEKIEFIQFGENLNVLNAHKNKATKLYDELLELTLSSEDKKTLMTEFDSEIKKSVIPFEKGEIGIGLSEQEITFNGYKAWATTFGKISPDNIQDRGVRDIVLERFSKETNKTLQESTKLIQEGIIDRTKLEEEQKAKREMGKDKIDLDMRAIESNVNWLKLSQKQIAYEGAFYAKLAEHLDKLGIRDIEDSALFIQLFYNSFAGKDPKRQKAIENWLKNLSDEKKKYFSDYLSIQSSIQDNPLLSNSIDFSLVNKAKFKELPFMFKQYKGEKEKTISDRKKNAMKFYYEEVLRVLGLDVNYVFLEEGAELPKNGPKQHVLSPNQDAYWKWETEKANGTTIVRRLKDNSDGYKKHLLWRAQKRSEWAKRFYDIAEILKRIASNLKAMLVGGAYYKFNPESKKFDIEPTKAVFKGFDGGEFESIKHYYEELKNAYDLPKNTPPTRLLQQNLVIQEKYWKIAKYRERPESDIEKALKKNTRSGEKRNKEDKTIIRN